MSNNPGIFDFWSRGISFAMAGVWCYNVLWYAVSGWHGLTMSCQLLKYLVVMVIVPWCRCKAKLLCNFWELEVRIFNRHFGFKPTSFSLPPKCGYLCWWILGCLVQLWKWWTAMFGVVVFLLSVSLFFGQPWSLKRGPLAGTVVFQRVLLQKMLHLG